MLQKIIKAKLKGSTLPEVLVAMVILTFCTTMAVMIYMNVQQNTMPFARIKAAGIAEKFMRKALEEITINDEEFKDEGYVIKRSIIKSEAYTGASIIKISVYNSLNKKLSELEVIK
jgi:Tfp pilus assembly protein PilV